MFYLCMFSVIALVVLGVTVGIWSILLNKDGTGYLKRAADSNTVELAQQEMNRALTYIESNNLTTGYTSIIYNTPSEDIEFWYINLTSAKVVLDEIIANKNATPLEKSNVLMKLRETLLDHSGSRESLTIPRGLARYPHNGLISVLTVMLMFVFMTTGGWRALKS